MLISFLFKIYTILNMSSLLSYLITCITIFPLSYLYARPAFNKHPKRDEDVWVLFIKNTQLSDTDLYVCELNGEPVLKTFHSLEGKFFTVSYPFFSFFFFWFCCCHALQVNIPLCIICVIANSKLFIYYLVNIFYHYQLS